MARRARLIKAKFQNIWFFRETIKEEAVIPKTLIVLCLCLFCVFLFLVRNQHKIKKLKKSFLGDYRRPIVSIFCFEIVFLRFLGVLVLGPP